MLRLRHIFSILFIILMVFLPIGKRPIVNYIDEIMTGLFIGLALLDCIINRRWKSYKFFWITFGIIWFYLAYTLLFQHYNKPSNILMDAFIEFKSIFAFAVIFGAGCTLSDLNKNFTKYVCATLATINSIVLLCGYHAQTMVSGHPAESGMTQYLCVMLFLLISLDSNLRWNKRDMVLALIWLIIGLCCGRSKYYAEFVLTLFFLFIYRPGILRHFKLKHAILIISLCLIVIAVVWKKFSYYYITGNSDTFDPNVAASYARPVLYLTGWLLLIDFFPFGSGFASFATYASQSNYSTLYYEYNLDKIWGLSPSYPNFICDGYYPSLAQFGFVGLVLFVCFWRFIYNRIRIYIHLKNGEYINYFKISTLLILFILIECTSGTCFTNPSGFITMILLGMLCRQVVNLQGDVHDNHEGLFNELKHTETKRITI